MFSLFACFRLVNAISSPSQGLFNEKNGTYDETAERLSSGDIWQLGSEREILVFAVSSRVTPRDATLLRTSLL